MWFNYQKFYNYIATLPDMNWLVEVGCWRGESTIHLAKKLIESQRPFELWAVDIWEYDPDVLKRWNYSRNQNVLEDYNKAVIQAGVRDHIKDLRMFSVDAAKRFANGSLDFVFLDADHRPHAVLEDIRAWLPKIRPQGILSGHDYYYQTLGYSWGEDDNVAEAVNRAVQQKIIPQPIINKNTSVWMVNV